MCNPLLHHDIPKAYFKTLSGLAKYSLTEMSLKCSTHRATVRLVSCNVYIALDLSLLLPVISFVCWRLSIRLIYSQTTPASFLLAFFPIHSIHSISIVCIKVRCPLKGHRGLIARIESWRLEKKLILCASRDVNIKGIAAMGFLCPSPLHRGNGHFAI